MRGLQFVFVLLILFLLPGCLRTNVLERQSIVLALGYDGKKDKNFQVTASFFESARVSKESSRSISVEAATSRSGRMKMDQKLPYELATGQTRVILLDKNIFKFNMVNEIDVLARDPNFGDMISIAIVDGTSQDILTYPYKDFQNIGISLNDILDHNTKLNWVPSMTLHDFTFGRGLSTLELAIPIISRKAEEISLTSLALLHDNQIVGEATPKEGFFLKTLKGTKNTPYLYESEFSKEDLHAKKIDRYVNIVHDEVKIVFQVIKGIGEIKLKDPSKKTFDANIDLNVNIEEVSQPYEFSEPGAIQTLEQLLSEKLTQDLQQFLDKLRNINSDCVGFGEKYRSQTGNSNKIEAEWGEIFPNTTLNGHVNIKIIRTGIIE